MQGRCGSCKRGAKKKNGFVNCEYVPRHTAHAPSLPCVFNPSRYEQRTDLLEGTAQGAGDGEGHREAGALVR